MQACAFVPVRNVGQAMCSFDLKNAKYIHEQIVPPMDFTSNRSTGLEPYFGM